MKVLSVAMLLLATPLVAAPPPDAVVTLWTSGPPAYGEIPEAMPLRFALFEDGRVFVGGTSEIGAGRLDKKEMKAIEKQLERVGKMGLSGQQAFGPGDRMFRLSARRIGEIVAKGEPSSAPAKVGTLAQLVETLLRFEHPSLRPFSPPSYAVAARESGLPGGCRSWLLPVALADALKQPQVIPATSAYGWPTGGTPAVVCSADRRYAVTFRPLLPGETP
jgi:hypothetical protein